MKMIDISTLFLRIALAAGFLSAVASRFNLWKQHLSFSESWNSFVRLTSEVNSFLPGSAIPFLAIMATIFEIAFAVLLIVGFKTYYTAFGAAILLLLFALAMTISSGIKEPLDYSVFAACAGAFLLASVSI